MTSPDNIDPATLATLNRISDFLDGVASCAFFDGLKAIMVFKHVLKNTCNNLSKWSALLVVLRNRSYSHNLTNRQAFGMTVCDLKMNSTFPMTEEPTMLIKLLRVGNWELQRLLEARKYDVQNVYWYLMKVINFDYDDGERLDDARLVKALENQGMLPRLIKKILKHGKYTTKRGIGKKKRMLKNRSFVDMTIKTI